MKLPLKHSALDEALEAIGLKPTRQSRSRATRLRLLAACHVLIEHPDFASLPVEQICQSADCSVGAFYNHFPTKDVLLAALVVWVCVEAEEEIDRACQEATSQDLLPRLVALTVANYRERQSFLRAVTRAAVDDDGVWIPIKRLGQHLVGCYLKALDAELPAATETRIRFGFQAMFGLLNNELVNSPGPFGLDHPHLVDRLCDLIRV